MTRGSVAEQPSKNPTYPGGPGGRGKGVETGVESGPAAGSLPGAVCTVNAVENGKYDPSLPLAFGIARVFGQTIEEIFSPDGDREDGAG